jgi:neural Wiskott-Aldrich syndrome protein
MAPPYTPPEPTPVSSRQPLYLIFQGERYVVEKDEFVIGRSSRSSDLVIANNDISRKHAAVVFMNGKYYIQDNESVNGIEFNGQRITQQQISEGDVYWLASYELRFTYRP